MWHGGIGWRVLGWMLIGGAGWFWSPTAGVAADVGAPGQLEAARVVAVDGVLQFVVLNIGRSTGVRVGMPLVVRRGDRIVGRVRVVEVRRTVCGAVIEQVEPGVTLAAGDTAQVARS